MSKEDEKAVQAEKKASNERAENKAAFSAALKNELDQRAEQLVSTLGAEGVDITKQLAPLVKDVFAGMLRAVTEAAEDLSRLILKLPQAAENATVAQLTQARNRAHGL